MHRVGTGLAIAVLMLVSQACTPGLEEERERRGLEAEESPDDGAEKPEKAPKPEEPDYSGPINTGVEGLTTFRGNASRMFYGQGPIPKHPEILWRYPASGGMCAVSDDGSGPRTWCGTGWTGQPNVVEVDGTTQVRFGAYDRAVHVLDATTGAELYEPFFTGDIIKGTVTSDPDGYPLLYSGSRDNFYHVLALDRGSTPVELWSLDAASAPQPMWNNDWDSSGLVIDDYLLEGGENSWFYVVKLNRGRDAEGKVTVDPEIRAMIPGFDDQLLADLGSNEVSIENSVAFREGIVYFGNSGGLIQGWDISRLLKGGSKYERVFRFWMGEDTDASVVIDDKGFLYASAELELFNARGLEVGQLVKLDPNRPDDPLVWSVPVPGESGGDGGIWSTPAIYRNALYATTNTGRLLAIDRSTGSIEWESPLAAPAWSSPVVVDETLIVGDCDGVLHAYDVSSPLVGPPPELWTVTLPGCIESTPAVWKGQIFVGSRDGGFYAIGDPES